MDTLARRADDYDGSRARSTILPPPPKAPISAPRVALGRVDYPFNCGLQEVDESPAETEELREPTDVDGRQWWDADEETMAITERSPRFHGSH
jgi:hypothetical protein